MLLDDLKAETRKIGGQYRDREARARRLFIQDSARALEGFRDQEFDLKTEIAQYFDTDFSLVKFCGSAQLGFSIQKDSLFAPGTSDLDVAIIDVHLFQKAWADIVTSTRSFTDMTKFGRMPTGQIDIFKDQILRRGMIRVSPMPSSDISREWKSFQNRISRGYLSIFSSISVAIYLNEYAFCWKQDSALAHFMR